MCGGGESARRKRQGLRAVWQFTPHDHDAHLSIDDHSEFQALVSGGDLGFHLRPASRKHMLRSSHYHTDCHTTVTSPSSVSHLHQLLLHLLTLSSVITLFITLLRRHSPHLHQLLLHLLVGQPVRLVHSPSLLQTVNSNS